MPSGCRCAPVIVNVHDRDYSGGGNRYVKAGIFRGLSWFTKISFFFLPLLIGRDSLFVLNFSFHILDGIWRLDLKGDGLAREGLYENLHLHSPV